MAKIYSNASRVIVWLGEAGNDGRRALQAICRVADEMSPEALLDDSTKKQSWHCFNGRGLSVFG
jgi:hypothetical protein